MRTIELKIPAELDIKDFDIAMTLAAKLYENRMLSAGQAAQLAGLSKRTFIELLGKYGVSVFNKDIADLHSDIANA